FLAGESEAADLFKFDFLFRRQFEQRDFVVERLACGARAPVLSESRMDGESSEFGIGGESQFAAGRFANGKTQFFAAARLTNDDFAIAFSRRDAVSEPLAVIGYGWGVDALPRQNVS